MIHGFEVKKCAILSNPRSHELDETFRETVELVRSECERVGIETQEFISVPIADISPHDDTDLFLVVGGDGTMIHFAGGLSPLGIPFYGLNYGNVGYMMNSVQPGLEPIVRSVRCGEFQMWEFPFLQVKATDLEGNTHDGFGLNDIYLQRMGSQVCRINISIEGHALAFNPIACDGVIVSTPLGSTAYSFNATGSIVAIDCHALTLTPLAANRTCPIKSLMLPLHTKIQIEVLEPLKRRALIVSDGNSQGDISFAEISISPRTVKLCFAMEPAIGLPLRFINKCRI